jgi:maltose alpha-D-glucosyltransferase/alpha-amylase
MLRSLSFVAQVALLRHINRKAGELQDLVGFARQWERQTSSLFLKTYCEAMRDAKLLPAGNDLPVLLEMFILERAFHELQYEINNRQQRAHIPLDGLLSILEGRAVL